MNQIQGNGQVGGTIDLFVNWMFDDQDYPRPPISTSQTVNAAPMQMSMGMGT
jgi:hypothetical protein